MRVEKKDDSTIIELTQTELRLLRRALERASFIDTPVEEQAQIAAFASRALELLPEQR